jgi:serine protease Do
MRPSGLAIILAMLATFGNVASLSPRALAQSREARKPHSPPLADLGRETLPAALYKRLPESVDDLRDIEDHVQGLIEKITACTVALQVGPAQGSGVLVSADGYILTAAHVSGPPEGPIAVTFPDGTETIGRTLGRNRTLDASLVKIEASDRPLPFVPLGKLEDIQHGDWCLVTGHPGGYQLGRPPVVRFGRVVTITDRLIQTDCELVGGDSGGPVFDMQGRVIGINSRIGEDTSFNLHVPIDVYANHWDRLVAGESFDVHSGAFLGVEGESVQGGLRLTTVWTEEPAEQAGLRAGDILLTFQGKPVDSILQLKELVGQERPGGRVRLTLRRDSQIMRVTVRLGYRPDQGENE